MTELAPAAEPKEQDRERAQGSADLDEIFSLADRILVVSEGKIVHETTAAAADVAVIGRHMAGHA